MRDSLYTQSYIIAGLEPQTMSITYRPETLLHAEGFAGRFKDGYCLVIHPISSLLLPSSAAECTLLPLAGSCWLPPHMPGRSSDRLSEPMGRMTIRLRTITIGLSDRHRERELKPDCSLKQMLLAMCDKSW